MRNLIQFRDFSEFKASALALIAANMLPLLGVLFLGWDTFSIVVLYWIENVIIGAINVLKMITCSPDPAEIEKSWSKFGTPLQAQELRKALGQLNAVEDKAKLAHHASKLFLVPFFIFHYGLFCFVHGVFVFAIFGREEGGFGPFGGFDNIKHVFAEEHLWWGVVALAASHLWSFFVNYLGHGEYRRTAVPLLMAQPYARVVVLHLAILFGGFVSFALGNNALVLAILVIGKTILDLSLHLAERARNAALPPAEQPPIFPEVITGEAGSTAAMPAAAGQSRPPARSTSDD